MKEYIVDTNVPLVANGASDMGLDCMAACIQFIEGFNQNQNILIIDDRYLILGEYEHGLNPKGQPGIGDRFLRWALTNSTNTSRVKQVSITPEGPSGYDFEEFPATLEDVLIDHSDKKFIALAKANQCKAPIAQASDSKWIGWINALKQEGIMVNFLCYQELEAIYQRKMG